MGKISRELACRIMDVMNNDLSFSCRYEMTGIIGIGGFACVYEGRNKDTNELCAVKVTPIMYENDIAFDSAETIVETEVETGFSSIDTYMNTTWDEKIENFENLKSRAQREISMIIQCSDCKNIVHYIDSGCVNIPKRDGSKLKTPYAGACVWISMELLEPASVSVSDELEAIDIGIDICTALHHIHSFHILHRDIKPQNILYSKNYGCYKLSDLGCARLHVDDKTLSLIRTTGYDAPEVLAYEMLNRKPGKYDYSIDIYSLGMTLYTMLNDNNLPFMRTDIYPSGETKVSSSDRRRYKGEPLNKAINASEEMMMIIQKACMKDPKDRYLTADKMKSDLIDLKGKIIKNR